MEAARHTNPVMAQSPAFLLLSATVVRHYDRDSERIGQYLLRAWAVGANLTPEQLSWLAGQITQLKPAWVREQLNFRQDEAAVTALFSGLWSILAGTPASLDLLCCFPVKETAQLPDDVLEPLLLTAINRGRALDDPHLDLVINRAARPDDRSWSEILLGLARQQDTQLFRIADLIGAMNPVPRPLLLLLFPLLLRSSVSAAAVRGILNKLTLRGDLNRGDDLVAVCLDNWQTLLIHRNKLRGLRGRGIDGPTLVGVVTEWVAYRDKPHRLDMMVIILRDVKAHNPGSWLTPVSLELQVLGAAGRFTEAARLVGQYDQLRVGRQSAGEFLAEARTYKPERQADYEDSLRRLWELLE